MEFDINIIKTDSYESFASLINSDGKPSFPRIWAIGNLKILDKPLLGLFCSKRCPGDIILKVYDLAKTLRDQGVPVISGFHTPMEKECLDLLLRGRQPIVICPARSITKMRLPKPWQNAIADERLLILSPFSEKHPRITAALSEERNRFVSLLSQSLFIAHASPNSRTETLCKKNIESGKIIYTFQSNTNNNLSSLGAEPVLPSHFEKIRWQV